MIAIVIPFYKKTFFEYCLESLDRQSNKNFHVYIGNDNSPEDPCDLISQFTENLNITYKKFSNNLGHKNLVAHWNRCINLVEDEAWIMILGDDDKLDSNCISDFYSDLQFVQERNINIVRFSTVKIDQQGNTVSRQVLHPESESSIDFIIKKFEGKTRSSLSEYIFRRDVVNLQGFRELPLAWHADDLALLEFSNFGDIFSINRSIVFFRNSGLNISSRTDNLSAKNRATFEFFYILLNSYGSQFTRDQKAFLIRRLEKAFLNDKKNIIFYFKLFKIFIKNPDLVNIKKFLSAYLTLVSKKINFNGKEKL